MKNKLTIASLLAISSVVHSNQLDDLIDASSAIVDQIDRGIMLVGAATEYSHHGDALSDGTLSTSAHITTAQLEAYNSALMGMQDYLPYGSVADVLENAATEQLELMG